MINQADVLRGHMEHIGGCGDGGCVVHVRPGMHTNGGCRCTHNPHTMFQVVHWHKRAVAEQVQQIERLREALQTADETLIEINLSNYGMDDVDRLNNSSIEASQIIRAALQPKEGNQ